MLHRTMADADITTIMSQRHISSDGMGRLSTGRAARLLSETLRTRDFQVTWCPTNRSRWEATSKSATCATLPLVCHCHTNCAHGPPLPRAHLLAVNAGWVANTSDGTHGAAAASMQCNSSHVVMLMLVNNSVLACNLSIKPHIRTLRCTASFLLVLLLLSM